MITEPILRRWVPHIEPDDLRNTLPELRCVRAHYATDLLRKAMPHATFEQSFPFVMRQTVHENGKHIEADVGVAQCYVWRFHRPVKFGARKTGVLLACFQQMKYWTNFALIEKLTPSEIEKSARLATRFTEFCPDCRMFGVLRHTGTWEHGAGLIVMRYRCSCCGALDERLFDDKHHRRAR